MSTRRVARAVLAVWWFTAVTTWVIAKAAVTGRPL